MKKMSVIGFGKAVSAVCSSTSTCLSVGGGTSWEQHLQQGPFQTQLCDVTIACLVVPPLTQPHLISTIFHHPTVILYCSPIPILLPPLLPTSYHHHLPTNSPTRWRHIRVWISLFSLNQSHKRTSNSLNFDACGAWRLLLILAVRWSQIQELHDNSTSFRLWN